MLISGGGGQEPLAPIRREILVPLSFGSASKIFLTSLESQDLNRWGYASSTTAGTDTTFFTPSMERFNSIKK